MGSGKTTVGQRLAKELHMPFFDSDEVIEKRNGVSITTIFDIEGEQGFRLREQEVIAELTDKNGIVLSTGGGAVLAEENRLCLQQRGFVVYLKASVDFILRRTSKDKKRPLLQGEKPRDTIEKILEQRSPLYEEIADLTINTDNRVSKDIVKLIYNYEVTA